MDPHASFRRRAAAQKKTERGEQARLSACRQNVFKLLEIDARCVRAFRQFLRKVVCQMRMEKGNRSMAVRHSRLAVPYLCRNVEVSAKLLDAALRRQLEHVFENFVNVVAGLCQSRA